MADDPSKAKRKKTAAKKRSGKKPAKARKAVEPSAGPAKGAKKASKKAAKKATKKPSKKTTGKATAQGGAAKQKKAAKSTRRSGPKPAVPGKPKVSRKAKKALASTEGGTPRRGRRRRPEAVKVVPPHLPQSAADLPEVWPPLDADATDPVGPQQVPEPKAPEPPAKKAKRSTRKRSAIKIGGHPVPKGTAEHILLKVSEHYTHQGVYIPVIVIRGKRPGPRVFLTAAVHGDEVNGVQIIREVLDRVSPEDLKGTLVAVPVVNRFGFVAHSRYMPDRRDLNRAFPGDPEASTTSRVAYTVFEEILKKCDYGIDLHTAGYHRTNLPQIRGDMDDDGVRRIAKAFGAEVILDSAGLKGTLRRTTTEAGVPTIIYEAGETFRFERGPINIGVTGILNVLRELKMVKGALERPRYQIIVKTSEWVRATHGGIMETFIQSGTLVYKGDVMATISNPFGHHVDHIRAPFNGLVVGVTMLPMVNPGAPICHLVKLKKTLSTVEIHHERADPYEETQVLESEPPRTRRATEEEDIEG